MLKNSRNLNDVTQILYVIFYIKTSLRYEWRIEYYLTWFISNHMMTLRFIHMATLHNYCVTVRIIINKRYS